MLTSLSVQSFRCLKKIEKWSVPSLLVLFGPNGTGKTSIFDAIALVRDCGTYGVQETLNQWGQGYGLRHRGSIDELTVSLGTADSSFSLVFDAAAIGLSSLPGEYLDRRSDNEWTPVFQKEPRESYFEVFDAGQAPLTEKLRDKTRLAWETVLNSQSKYAGRDLWYLLRDTVYCRTRVIDLMAIKNRGCDASAESQLRDANVGHCQNLWSVLQNLNNERDSDMNGKNPSSRYGTILGWTKRAFSWFEGWRFQSGGSSQVYCEAKLVGFSETVPARQMADGLIQFTILMAALFGQEAGAQLVMLDEPDLSLHPWALFVLAEAIEDATKNWGRQVLLATHSPTLLSQFPEDSLYLMMPKDGATTIQKVSEIEDKKDLLAQYAVGSLYMMQMIGEQSPEAMVDVVETKP